MMFTKLFILIVIEYSACNDKVNSSHEKPHSDLDEHSVVTDSTVFPYVVSILKKSKYLSAGAIVHENWVLTAADAFFMIRDSARMLRVRLGSVNYKKGGLVLPIKYFEIHPSFDDHKPIYDLALIRLPYALRFTPNIKSIQLQSSLTDVDSTHYIVTAWQFPSIYSEESLHVKSMETIKKQRLLSVSLLHPSDIEDCADELITIGIHDAYSVMCLETDFRLDSCMRDVGAPVVLNNILWGIISSWKSNNCENELAGPAFVNLVSAPNISNWIQTTIKGKHSRN